MISTPFKIGILGTHGAGKTTLALALAARIKTARPDLAVEALAETARACPLPIGEQTTADSQRWIFCRQMSAEIETAARCQVLVCDRTILDNLAYAEADVLDLAYLFLSAALDWLTTYHRLYWVRPTGAPVADGVRSADVKFQRLIDDIIDDWVDQYALPVIEVRGDFERVLTKTAEHFRETSNGQR